MLHGIISIPIASKPTSTLLISSILSYSRHTHPSADALQQAMKQHNLKPSQIKKVTAHVYQAAIDVLSSGKDATTIHQSKFSMGFVLAQIACRGSAGITDFTEASLKQEDLRDFMKKVEMVVDPEIEAAYPARWIGLVDVETIDGKKYTVRVEEPKGDPGNTLSRQELEAKTYKLIKYSHGASDGEAKKIIHRVWNLENERNVRDWLV